MKNRLHINNFPLRIVALLMLLTFAGHSFAQPKVSIGTRLSCENSITDMAVDVSDFYDIASFTFFLTIDTLQVNFESIVNTHSELAGSSIIYNFVPQSSTIIITWSSLSAANIEFGKLFDIKLKYFSGDASLEFQDNCELVLSDLTIIENVSYEDGLLLKAIQFSSQPAAQSVNQNQEAHFNVSLHNQNGQEFQWQQYDGSVWIDLLEALPYVGVFSDHLMINEAPLGFNGYAYRCKVSYNNCWEMSDSALLEVSPLAVVSLDADNHLMEVFPNPCANYFNYDTGLQGNYFLRLINLQGKLIKQDLVSGEGNFSMEGWSPGLYYLQMTDVRGTILDVVKLMHN